MAIHSLCNSAIIPFSQLGPLLDFFEFFFLICSPQHTKPASAPPHRATGNNSITRQPMVRSNRRLNLLGAQDPVHAAMPIFSVSNHLIFILLPNVPVLQTPPVQLVNRLCHGRLCVMVDCGIDPAKRGQGWANTNKTAGVAPSQETGNNYGTNFRVGRAKQCELLSY